MADTGGSIPLGRYGMNDESLHWSEGAKLAHPSDLPLVSVTSDPPPRKSKKKYLLEGIVVLIIAAIAVAVVVLLSRGESAADASKASMIRYEDPILGFSFEYPGTWGTRPFGSGMRDQVEPLTQVAFGDPEGAVYEGMGIDFIRVGAVEAPTEFTEAMRPTLRSGLEQQMTLMKVQVAGLEVTEPIAEFETNGIRGLRVGFTAPAGGDTVVCEMYFLPAGHIQYQITVQASRENWEADKPLFDAAVGSFRIASSAAAASPTEPTGPSTSTTDNKGLACYADTKNGFTVKYPARWENTDASRLGFGYSKPHAAVGFADRSGPTFVGQYLDFLDVVVFDDRRYDESMLSDFMKAMTQGNEDAKNNVQGFEVIEPVHSIEVDGMPGLAMTTSYSGSYPTVFVYEYLFIADGRLMDWRSG